MDASVHTRLDEGFAAMPDVRVVSNLDRPIGTAKEGINVWEARVWGVFFKFANVPAQLSYRKGSIYGERSTRLLKLFHDQDSSPTSSAHSSKSDGAPYCALG